MAEVSGNTMSNIDAEFEVISACIKFSDNIDRLALTPEAFSDIGCREVFQTLLRLQEGGDHIDAITVADALPVNGVVNKVGGLVWLGEIISNTLGTNDGVDRYAAIVKKYHTDRKIAAAGTEINLIAVSRGSTTNEKLSKADELIAAIADARDDQGATLHIRPAMQMYVETLQKREEAGMPGMPTGLQDLDEITGGIQLQNLYVIGARPSMGKTSLVTGIATAVATTEESAYGKEPHGVLFLSMEMPTVGIVDRIVASKGSIDLSRLIKGKLLEDDYTRFSAALGCLYQAPLWINDTSALTLSRVRSLIRERKKDHLKLVIFDYMQLMQAPGNSRNAQIEEISRGLKQIAKDFNVAVIALSQLSRDVEKRTDKRPMMSDLRDSGSIEQDADVIIFAYRDEVYNPETQDKGIAELIIAKQRNGPTGTVRTYFRGEYTRFDNAERAAFCG